MNDWRLAEIWNKALEVNEQRPVKSRDNLWASELGKSPIDLFLKLKGTEPTNPPNARSLRKFEAGNVFEWIVSLILKRAGILTESQKWSSYQYPDLLKVTGKADFIAGGIPEVKNAIDELKNLGIPQVFIRGAESIAMYLEDKGELKTKPLEIKSVSAFMFDAIEKSGKAMKNHRMQLFHYLKSDNYTQGAIIYICRDDLRMFEIPVFNPSAVEDEYREAITTISKFVQEDKQPPLEKEIIFDEEFGRFSQNFNVGYSGYLTMLYGYKDQKEVDDKNRPIVSKWNRVLARAKDKKNLTPKNLDVIEEIKKSSFNFDECVKFALVEEEEEIN